jgi:putative intracellular protease/amidase
MPPRSLRYLLITDGSSDSCLKHPIEWLLREHGWDSVEGEWADLRVLPESATTLAERVRIALDYYSGDLILVHHDAEAESPDTRVREITAAVAALGYPIACVCVVPVRMTEAWLLHDKSAICVAAGKPKGGRDLELPPLKQLEKLADPKAVLRDALLSASEATGHRRRRKLRDFGVMRHRVAERIGSYAPLRALDGFARLEADLCATLEALGHEAQSNQS